MLSLQSLICPNCHGRLAENKEALLCPKCSQLFAVNEYGYINFLAEETYNKDTYHEGYAERQAVIGSRIFHEYLKPIFLQEPFSKVLDIGCGVGKTVATLLEEGYEAYGIDLPQSSIHWKQYGNSSRAFICADALKLPFPDEYFDIAFSLGVIEHIGTTTGHCTLHENYREMRQRYADELLRVVKPDGRILISCPNKLFPVDIHHGPVDQCTRMTMFKRLREGLYKRYGINLHMPWGTNHLLSFADVKKLFCNNGGAHSIKSIPLRNYFEFNNRLLRRGILKAIVEAYVNNLPEFMLSGIFNPYVMALIIK